MVLRILASLFLFSAVCSAGNYEDGIKARKNGKTLQSALSFTKGCVNSEKKSCSALCAIGTEKQNLQWQVVGCSAACNLGDHDACGSYGGLLVMKGETIEGKRLLKQGCQKGSDISCDMLNMLNK